MTLGQRIVEQRKKLGLSQEALGERLGLSRQAVSKWEADAAIPEVDKLIALSRLFSVPVGWLLGVEEEISSAQSKEEALTDVQLKLVEEIVQRYLAARPEPAPTRRERWWNSPRALMLLAFAFLILLIAGIKVGGSISAELSGYRSNVSGLAASYQLLQEQISGLQYRMDALTGQMEEQTKLLSGWTLTPSGGEAAVAVTLSATPKEYQEGDQGIFSVQLDGEEIARSECQWNGVCYTASAELAIEDGYSYCFILNRAGGQTFEILADLSNPSGAYELVYLKESTTPEFTARVLQWTTEGATGLRITECNVSYTAPSYSLSKTLEPVSMDWVLYVNGEEVSRAEEQTVKALAEDVGPDELLSGFDSDTPVDFACALTEGDYAELRAELHLQNGLNAETVAGCWIVRDGALLEE
ncbi:MAG: helix-turn-helix domain-containing protein [Candidatus Onthomonas sp.]